MFAVSNAVNKPNSLHLAPKIHPEGCREPQKLIKKDAIVYLVS